MFRSAVKVFIFALEAVLSRDGRGTITRSFLLFTHQPTRVEREANKHCQQTASVAMKDVAKPGWLN